MQVSADPRAAARAVTKEWDGLTIGSLLPGMLVNARVRSVLADGFAASFLTYFHGTVDCFHLGQVSGQPPLSAAGVLLFHTSGARPH